LERGGVLIQLRITGFGLLLITIQYKTSGKYYISLGRQNDSYGIPNDSYGKPNKQNCIHFKSKCKFDDLKNQPNKSFIIDYTPFSKCSNLFCLHIFSFGFPQELYGKQNASFYFHSFCSTTLNSRFNNYQNLLNLTIVLDDFTGGMSKVYQEKVNR
jgi:hypothetical protein